MMTNRLKCLLTACLCLSFLMVRPAKLATGQSLPVTPLHKLVWRSASWGKMAATCIARQGALQHL